MPTIRITGLDAYIRKLESLTENAEESCKRAVWEGGRVVGDSIRSALSGIPVQDEYVPNGEKRKGIYPDEKEEIDKAFGLSKMRNEGGVISTKAGFRAGTKIRAVESGTSYMKKTPIVRPAVNRARGAAEEAMKAELEKEIEKYMS